MGWTCAKLFLDTNPVRQVTPEGTLALNLFQCAPRFQHERSMVAIIDTYPRRTLLTLTPRRCLQEGRCVLVRNRYHGRGPDRGSAALGEAPLNSRPDVTCCRRQVGGGLVVHICHYSILP